ncbi:hypothetical protein FPSE5266_09576 [Fusarium pseudograminearum]|nr:hypothetical protein FPSE5266_09576 [Fusarium pseudograminearum]
MKLFLKSHLDERHFGDKVDYDILQQVILRHTMFEESHSHQGENPPDFVTELLRLLTFEALEITHTCCTFEVISDDIVTDLFSTASCKPAAIFGCRAEKVREIRSCDEERLSARLLEDLMSEFTSQLRRQGSDAQAFERFITGYWRRRISEIYHPNPQVLSEMEQHQIFRGFKASSDVKKYVLPKRVLRLLGKDFQLTELDVSEDDST